MNKTALRSIVPVPAQQPVPVAVQAAGKVADRLGVVLAEIAPLNKEAEQLKDMLRASGLSVVEGDLFRATISVPVGATSTNWEGVARTLAKTARLSEGQLNRIVTRNTITGEPGKARIAVKSRKGE